jgi:hypothetical protein
VAIGDQGAGRSSSGHGSTMPNRSRTATMTSLHAKRSGSALALPCWSGETARPAITEAKWIDLWA